MLPDSWPDLNTESRAALGNEEKWRMTSLPLVHFCLCWRLFSLDHSCKITLFKSSINQNLLSNLYLFKGAQQVSQAKVGRAEYAKDATPRGPFTGGILGARPQVLGTTAHSLVLSIFPGTWPQKRNLTQAGRFDVHCVRGREFDKIKVVISSNYWFATFLVYA